MAAGILIETVEEAPGPEKQSWANYQFQNLDETISYSYQGRSIQPTPNLEMKPQLHFKRKFFVIISKKTGSFLPNVSLQFQNTLK
jgi:hypothetical protein